MLRTQSPLGEALSLGLDTLRAALTLSPAHPPPTPLCSPQPPHPGLLPLPAAPIMPPSQASTSTLEHHVWPPSPPLGVGSQSPSRPPFIGEQPLPCAAHWPPVPLPQKVSPVQTGLWSPFALPAQGLASMGAQGTLAMTARLCTTPPGQGEDEPSFRVKAGSHLGGGTTHLQELRSAGPCLWVLIQGRLQEISELCRPGRTDRWGK